VSQAEAEKTAVAKIGGKEVHFDAGNGNVLSVERKLRLPPVANPDRVLNSSGRLDEIPRCRGEPFFPLLESLQHGRQSNLDAQEGCCCLCAAPSTPYFYIKI
jgi:hypothetical protein